MEKSLIQNEFEKWAKSKELRLDLNAYGMGAYDDIETEILWECWQTAWNKAFEVL